MGIFPDGSQILTPERTIAAVDSENGIIYHSPANACTIDACDALFKIIRDSGISGKYAEYSSLDDSRSRVSSGSLRMVEFMDPVTREPKHSHDYVTSALAGVFDNETDRLMIPRVLLTQ